MLNEIWAEKYRPLTVEECILPLKTKRLLGKYVSSKKIPDLLFVGTSGIGKTTAARALMEETETECITVNSSLHGNIDEIRTRVMQFASTVAMNGQRKFVHFEEFDKMTAAAQQALKAFIEEFTSNCGYIFSGNNVALLDGAIKSRLTEVSFAFDNDEKIKLAKQMYARILNILKKEKITFEEKDVQHLLVEYFKRSTDLRQLLIRLQKFSESGTFEPDLLTAAGARLQSLVDVLKSRKVRDIRTWAGENSDLPADMVFTFLYDNIDAIAKPEGVAAMIAHLAEHQFQHPFVANPEINVAACLIDIASESV